MTPAQKLIRNKLGLLELAAYLQNVSEACCFTSSQMAQNLVIG